MDGWIDRCNNPPNNGFLVMFIRDFPFFGLEFQIFIMNKRDIQQQIWGDNHRSSIDRRKWCPNHWTLKNSEKPVIRDLDSYGYLGKPTGNANLSSKVVFYYRSVVLQVGGGKPTSHLATKHGNRRSTSYIVDVAFRFLKQTKLRRSAAAGAIPWRAQQCLRQGARLRRCLFPCACLFCARFGKTLYCFGERRNNRATDVLAH